MSIRLALINQCSPSDQGKDTFKTEYHEIAVLIKNAI